MTHRRDMSKERVKLLIGIEDAVLCKVIGRPNRAYALAPGLLVDRLGALIRWYRYVVRPVRRHCHLRYQSFQDCIPLSWWQAGPGWVVSRSAAHPNRSRALLG